MPAKTINRDETHLGYVDMSKNEVRNLRLHQLGADPGSPVDGLLLYRTDTFRPRARINGAWQDLAFVSDLSGAGIPASTFTTKGDLLLGTGSGTYARQGVGADNTFLVAASGQANGVQYRALATGDIGTALLQEKIATADLTDWPRTAALDINSQKITGLADGTATTDAATFGQLAAILEGKKWKQDPAAAATTAALPAVTYNAGAGTLTENANGALAAQDGVTLAVGDTLLVKNQASTFQNGLYTVTALGSGAAVFVLTRRADGNTATELNNGATIYVAGGTTQGGDIYTQTSALADLTASTQTWTKTGDTNVVYTADGTTITLTGTQFAITALGVGTGQLAAQAVTAAKLGAVVGNGLTGGAGSVIAVQPGAGILADGTSTRVDTSLVVRKTTGALTGGSNSEVITHNLNTRTVELSLRNNSSPWDEVDVYNEATTVNTMTVYAASGQNLPAGYTWIVVG